MFDQDKEDMVGARGFVSWTYCNWAQRDFALNWYRHLIEQAADLRPLIFCVDDATQDYLTAAGARTASIKLGFKIREKEVGFRSSVAWARLMLVKVLLTHAMAKAGLPQFYCDTDVVARRDPIDAVLRAVDGHDIAFQDDYNGAICAGLFFAQPSEGVCRLFDVGAQGLPPYELNDPAFSDQIFLTQRLEMLGQSLSVALLPREVFPTGKVWFPQREALADRALMVHYNWQFGSHNKIAKMKLDNAWLSDEHKHA